MTEIENLLDWATSKGVALNGIAPKVLLGRGIGIVATRALKVRRIHPHQPGHAFMMLISHVVQRSCPERTSKHSEDAREHALLHHHRPQRCNHTRHTRHIPLSRDLAIL